jgi:F0F1-type ATP synthase assembly protein I
MIQKFVNPFIMFIIVGAFLGYFILPEILFSFFKITIDKGLGVVIGGALGYFLGRYI